MVDSNKTVVLVTGATGVIGNAIARALAATHEYELVLLARMSVKSALGSSRASAMSSACCGTTSSVNEAKAYVAGGHRAFAERRDPDTLDGELLDSIRRAAAVWQ